MLTKNQLLEFAKLADDLDLNTIEFVEQAKQAIQILVSEIESMYDVEACKILLDDSGNVRVKS